MKINLRYSDFFLRSIALAKFSSALTFFCVVALPLEVAQFSGWSFQRNALALKHRTNFLHILEIYKKAEIAECTAGRGDVVWFNRKGFWMRGVENISLMKMLKMLLTNEEKIVVEG